MELFNAISYEVLVLTLCWERTADGMKTFDEVILVKNIKNILSHTSHNPHTGHHIGGICALDPDLRQRRTNWPHAEGDDVHGTT